MIKGTIIGVCIVGTLIAGVVFFSRPWSRGPFYEIMDEDSPETDAVITLSDPLLYARETLINDRRREYEFLNNLLAKSAEVQFSPQLARDMNVLSSVNTQAAARISSSTNTEFKLPPKAVAPDQDRPANSQDRPANSQDRPANSQDKLQYSPNEEFRDRQAYRNELRAALASVNLDDLHDFAGNALFRLQFKASIFPGKQKNKYGVARLTLIPPKMSIDDLETLYLTWLGHISSRLNVYDAQGNLVVDGRYESTGIAPTFTYILKLPIDPRAADPREDICLAYQEPLTAPLPQVCTILALAVGPADRAAVKDLFRDRSDAQLLTFFEQATTDRDYFERSICRDPLKQEKFRQAVLTGKQLLEVMQTLSAAFNGVAVGNSSSNNVNGAENTKSSDFLSLRSRYLRLGQQAARMRDHVRALEAPANYMLSLVSSLACSEEVKQRLPSNFNFNPRDINKLSTETPKSFTLALLENGSAGGQAYGLGTAPSELGQRLTTTARATASLDIALAVQASRQEAELHSATELARSAARTAAALERVPLVVGFSDRQSIDNSSKSYQAPQFGWVFGPRIRLDASNGFTFEQSVAAYDLSADVSVPSWWPRLDLQLETAWVRNWYSTSKVLPPVLDGKKGGQTTEGHQHKGLISIPLPLNRADLDGLTKFLTRRAFGASQELTTIRFIEPPVISACAKEVTFLIYGANIWRNTEVFFGGARATQITVLPDMEGIAATFQLLGLLDQKNWTKNPLGYEEVALRVNTRNGNDFRPVRVMGQRVQNGDCESPYNVTTPIVQPRHRSAPVVFELSPSSIRACADATLIVLSGQHLLSLDNKQLVTEFYLGSQKAEAKVLGAGGDAGAVEIVELLVRLPTDLKQSTGRAPLIAANQNGMVSMSVGILPCSEPNASHASSGERKQ